jgi:hypothetical protein
MTVNTPEHAAASLEVRIKDALQPLVTAAAKLEAAAGELRLAAEQGDTLKVQSIGADLLPEHAGFALTFRMWLVERPDAPPWRSLVADAVAQAHGQPVVTVGGDPDDRMST